MNAVRGPQNLAQCPFHILREDPLSATASIEHCVKCVTGQNAVLQEQSEEFQQTAFLTVIEASALYDPDHPSGASFITFIKSKVCSALWQHRRELQKYLPCGDVATEEATETETFNPLVAGLGAAACSAVSLEDTVIDDLETQRFRDALPVLFRRLTAPEKKAVRWKYFHDATGAEIATALGVSRGRVSQLLKRALAKIKQAYTAHTNTVPTREQPGGQG